MISSLFRTHEEIYRTWASSRRHKCPSVYFHGEQVSYPSQVSKRACLEEMESGHNRLLPRWATALDLELATMRAEAMNSQMESSHTYKALIESGRESKCAAWTALFYTQDTSWHYWGAVFIEQRAGAKVELDIYISNLAASLDQEQQEGFEESQLQLQAECGRYDWQAVHLHRYTDGNGVEVDEAFCWTKSWVS
jgi:hypothetical protein